jgi:hypothetical protein
MSRHLLDPLDRAELNALPVFHLEAKYIYPIMLTDRKLGECLTRHLNPTSYPGGRILSALHSLQSHQPACAMRLEFHVLHGLAFTASTA